MISTDVKTDPKQEIKNWQLDLITFHGSTFSKLEINKVGNQSSLILPIKIRGRGGDDGKGGRGGGEGVIYLMDE